MSVVVITGASSGIGAATARRLAQEGSEVVLIGRRSARIASLAREVGGVGVTLDVTDRAAVDAFAAELGPCHGLINIAGGAIGADSVATASPADWANMFNVNVLGSLNMTQALLPALLASQAGTIVFLTSTAAQVAYEGGGGYCAAKHAQHALAATLRLELCGQPIRVVEVAPGMVRTAEFAVNRFRGDQAKADAVYAGVPAPLVAEDIAECVAFALKAPEHLNVDLLVVRPRDQAAQHKIHRTPTTAS
jgi:NADP-dependent 3-hydroxy acid dehydrogenase YdfG